MRWAVGGGGKSGGVRVIYYFVNVDRVLYLIDLYRKNEKSNLSQRETTLVASICKALLAEGR